MSIFDAKLLYGAIMTLLLVSLFLNTLNYSLTDIKNILYMYLVQTRREIL